MSSSSLIPQPHGGALRRGGNRGNRGNRAAIGRPPSIIREKLRGSFQERIPLLEQIIDGTVVQQTRVEIMDILPHLTCKNCGEQQIAATDPEKAEYVEINAMVSASPKDRIAALDLQAKYGLGQLKEISIEQVRERVAQTLAVIRQHVPPETYEKMAPQLRAAWA